MPSNEKPKLSEAIRELEAKATKGPWEIERKYSRSAETAYTAVTSIYADVARVIFDTSNADDNLIEDRSDGEGPANFAEVGHDADLELTILLRTHALELADAWDENERLRQAIAEQSKRFADAIHGRIDAGRKANGE